MDNKTEINKNKSIATVVKKAVGSYGSVLIAVSALCIICSFASPYFLTITNMKNIGVYMAASGIIAAGVTVSMLLGGLDLSQMAIMAFAGVCVGLAYNNGIRGVWLLFIALGIGLACGFVNAFIINVMGIDMIITTIGTQLIFRALAFIVSDGNFIVISDDFIKWIGRGKLLGLSVMIWIMAAVFLIVGIILKYTQFGRNVICVGGSPQAAYLSGINVKKTKTMAFLISASCAGLSSLLFVAQANVCAPNAGNGSDMDCIAAVIIGGLSVSGGKGTIVGTALGMVFFSVLANGMGLLSMGSYAQMLIKGALLLLAVFIDSARNKKNS